MKKLFTLMLAAMLVVSTVSCTSSSTKNDEPIKGERVTDEAKKEADSEDAVEVANDEEEAEDTVEIVDDEEEEAEDTVEIVDDEEEEAEDTVEIVDDEEEEAEETTLAFGKTEDNVYENASFGLGFKLPDSWIFLDEDGISAIVGIADLVSGEDMNLEETIAETGMAMDMYAMDANGNTVNIIISELPVQLTESDAINKLLVSQMDAQIESIYTEYELEEAKSYVDGKLYYGSSVTGKLYGVEMSQRTFWTTNGKYMANVTLTGTTMDPEDLLDYFYLVK